MAILTETTHAGGFILGESDWNYSKENRVLISGQNLAAGAVIGRITAGTATSAAKGGGNTGNGTSVVDVTTPVLANAMPGIYTVRNNLVVANGGQFEVKDPLGRSVGQDIILPGAGASVTFADQIKFVLTDGSTDFALGDGFDITVAAGSGKITVLAPAALDGSQNAAGILFAAVDATSADQPCVTVERVAEVNGNELVWPGGITGPQKTAAQAQLTALGIIQR